MIFFHLLSRVKLFFFSEKVGISQNCILTLLSTFLLFFFLWVHTNNKKLPDIFLSCTKKWISPMKKIYFTELDTWKNLFSNMFRDPLYNVLFHVWSRLKTFFLGWNFFFHGDFFLCVCVEPSAKHLGFFWPLYVFSDRTDWERGSDTQQTAPGQDLNPGLLQWGQSLCAWDETEPHIILILIQRLLNRIGKICPSCT